MTEKFVVKKMAEGGLEIRPNPQDAAPRRKPTHRSIPDEGIPLQELDESSAKQDMMAIEGEDDPQGSENEEEGGEMLTNMPEGAGMGLTAPDEGEQMPSLPGEMAPSALNVGDPVSVTSVSSLSGKTGKVMGFSAVEEGKVFVMFDDDGSCSYIDQGQLTNMPVVAEMNEADAMADKTQGGFENASKTT